MAEDCLFCKIIAGEVPSTIVHQDDDVVAFEDINPQAPTHVVIVPRQHIPTVNDLDDADQELFGKLATAAKQIAGDRGIAEDGYRLVMNCNAGAGQSVWHIHMHLLGGRRLRWPPG
jgi:histidine triad (HIT) family protein